MSGVELDIMPKLLIVEDDADIVEMLPAHAGVIPEES